MNLLRKKHVADFTNHNHVKLRQCLTAFDLTLLGIGAIIGAGIFVLTGIAAATKAGPGLVLSYVLAGFACAFAALAYAELSAGIGGCGSAYGYAYAGLGEIFAWLIGWDLLLEYAVSTSAVSVGWSGYFDNFLNAINIHIPYAFSHSPFQHGILNLPAFSIIIVLAILLILGAKLSAQLNNVMVIVKLAVVLLFIAVAAFNVQPQNWHPFLPFGFQGVVNGAALIFFAYIGFDAVSTAAEEAINPQRDLPIGIITSLLICTVLYMVVTALLTGIMPYFRLNVSSPISFALDQIGYRMIGGLVGVGAIAGLTTVMLVMYYGLTRVFLAMSRDGLISSFFAKLNGNTHTPVRVILLCGIFMSLFSAFIPISELAELVNIGTLAAFITVCAGVIILRYTQPDLPRPFKTPFSPLIPILGIICCAYLIISLPMITILRFIVWMLIGLGVYFLYGRKKSKRSL